MPAARHPAPVPATPALPQKASPAEVLPEPIRQRLERQGLLPAVPQPDGR
ncbi:hypothetical protein [Aquabacterium sp. J223]|nr:hypothetical protein [Aquabacterium sp. J223]UUX94118.1 hypothetical protein LRS07_12255 [Aquabacterium sp. J223]